MSTAGLSRSVAFRVLRATPMRTAMIAITIAVPTGFAVAAVTADWTGAFGAAVAALVITTAMVIVAQSSQEPTSVASVVAWQAAGADQFTATRSRRDALRLVGWGAVAVGSTGGLVVGVRAERSAPNWESAALLVIALGLVVFTGAAVAWRIPPRRRGELRIPTEVRLAVSAGVSVILFLVAVAISPTVSTDWQAFYVIPICATLLVASLILAIPVLRMLILRVVGTTPSWRGVDVLAERHHGRLLVRVVVVVSFVVAAVASVLGSSVAERDEGIEAALAEVNDLPPVPANVMALTFPEPDIPASVPTPPAPPPPTITDTQTAELRDQFPDTEIVPVRHLDNEPAFAMLSCFFQTHCAPLVVADPRLDAVYGREPSPAESVQYAVNRQPDQTVVVAAALSVPDNDELLRFQSDGSPLPTATWHELNFMQVNTADVERVAASTAVRTVFLMREAPYTEEDHQALAAFAAAQGGLVQPTVVTSADRSTDFANRSIGTAPWAPIDPSTRWSITLIAAILALIAVVGTSSVDAIDRWRDNERLEVLGASPVQLRAAAALHSWMELGVAALFAVGLTVMLAAIGVHQFNADSDLEVPFVVPWTQIVFLAVVVPAIGVGIAAAVARPFGLRSGRTAAVA